ncbi:MAG: hypothetical protein KDD70_09595 [Bdellovibrionales bacterium]|nr:hypothetical protein [Bdellovibrionales bacterium]
MSQAEGDARESLSVGEVREAGRGRVYLLVYDSKDYTGLASSLFDELSKSNRCLLFRSSFISDESWEGDVVQFLRVIEENALRHFSIIAFGGASTLAQYVALKNSKNVRSLVLVDGSCRPHPSWMQRLIDRAERRLPLGLPLRRNHPGFDGMPYLHRVRCPVLLVVSSLASPYQSEQAEYMRRNLATAWLYRLEGSLRAESLVEALEVFQTLPVKCPQKNVTKQRLAENLKAGNV